MELTESFLILSYPRSINILDKISSALRFAVLIELAANENISMDFNSEIIYIKKFSTNQIKNEILNKIDQKQFPVKKWIKVLNGESFNYKNRNLQIKKLRVKYFTQLKNKNYIIDFKIRVIPQFISVLPNMTVKEKLINDLITYLLNENTDILKDSLILLLDYVNNLNFILNEFLNDEKLNLAYRKIMHIREKIKFGEGRKMPNALICLILRILNKK